MARLVCDDLQDAENAIEKWNEEKRKVAKEIFSEVEKIIKPYELIRTDRLLWKATFHGQEYNDLKKKFGVED